MAIRSKKSFNAFTDMPAARIKSNRFDLSHDVKASFDMGELVPTLCLEVVPGDRFSMSAENMYRLAPLVSPTMHEVNAHTHFFYVANRTLWPGWEDFITGRSTSPAPFIATDEIPEGSVADYIGIPTGSFDANIFFNALPYAAYAKIYDEYYRDQNLISPVFTELIPGSNNSTYLSLAQNAPLKKAWEHDYFTSCLPDAQQGSAVQIPLTVQDDIPVTLDLTKGPSKVVNATTGFPVTGSPLASDGSGNLLGGPTSTTQSSIDPDGNLVVDVQSDAVDISTLRSAWSLQAFLERMFRTGQRYIETLAGHFGVRSSDQRLQRPEYIGGTKQRMVISEVLATSQDTMEGIPLGTMAGHGISVGGGNRSEYVCEEHGFIIGLTFVMPRTAYQQGLHKMHSRFDRLDYMWPDFAHLGEQAVLNKEVYLNHSDPDGTFGYMPPYQEYRFMNSRVAGEFRSSLSYWHMGRIFATDPQLNEDFVTADPTTRIFAVEEGADHVYAHIFYNILVDRKLPRYGIPSTFV